MTASDAKNPAANAGDLNEKSLQLLRPVLTQLLLNIEYRHCQVASLGAPFCGANGIRLELQLKTRHPLYARMLRVFGIDTTVVRWPAKRMLFPRYFPLTVTLNRSRTGWSAQGRGAINGLPLQFSDEFNWQ